MKRSDTISTGKQRLIRFFEEHSKAALAFSGGVDSSYLLQAAAEAGADVTAYHVKSAFQPEFELMHARKIAEITGMRMKVLAADVLSDAQITANPPNRCYYCKRKIFAGILQAAKTDGYNLVLDGTNASDDSDDRPGMKALQELEVRSPLRECGLTKADVRALSKEAGLFTWNKPSYACLATRIPAGEVITAAKLEKTEKAESFLHGLGFSDFRVRMTGEAAKLQVKEEQFALVMEEREKIRETLKQWYSEVLLDLGAR